jgi:hypothetical protein
MTALNLAWRMVWGIASGEFRPGDRVVREWGDWDEEGRSTYKEVYFLDRKRLPAHPDLSPAPGGLNHTMYGDQGTLPPRRLVVLN